MSLRTNQVGFSQRIRLEWLGQAANLVLGGNDAPAIHAELQNILLDKVSIGSNADRGNRGKIITIISRVWVNVPEKTADLRVDALELLKRLPGPQRLAVHWGMVAAVYPFWAAVAGCVGRLLRLQGSVAAIHVQRRIREQYGERETVSRATRRVLRSFVDWGVLKETNTKGVYDQGLHLPVDDPALAAWLIEASLHARSDGTGILKDLIENPSLFPFSLNPPTAGSLLALSLRLEVARLGLDEDLVVLREKDRPKEGSGR